MSELPLMHTNESDFNEVKKDLHDNDSAWIRQQFGLKRLSPNFRLSRAFCRMSTASHCCRIVFVSS